MQGGIEGEERRRDKKNYENTKSVISVHGVLNDSDGVGISHLSAGDLSLGHGEMSVAEPLEITFRAHKQLPKRTSPAH